MTINNRLYRRLPQVFLTTCFGTLLLNPVYADPATRDMRYFDEVPAASDIAAQLFPRRTRGIVIKNPVSTPPASQVVTRVAPQVAPQATPQATERSVALPVHFHFGKTTLIAESKPYLDSIGEFMLKEEYLDETLIIEGHTDSIGPDNYNQRLSELRALAVKDYLVDRYGIDPLRLFPAGKGESQLYDQANPKSGRNRRVEFLRYNIKS